VICTKYRWKRGQKSDHWPCFHLALRCVFENLIISCQPRILPFPPGINILNASPVTDLVRFSLRHSPFVWVQHTLLNEPSVKGLVHPKLKILSVVTLIILSVITKKKSFFCFFLFFAHKKYSRRLINLRLSHCSHSFVTFGPASFELL